MKSFCVWLTASAILCGQSAVGQERKAGSVPVGTETARAKVYPALVNITVVARYYQGGRAQRTPGGGSGVLVTPQGHVITNYHVAGNTSRIICTLPDGESVEAKVIAHDIPSDLSVLKLRTEKRKGASAPLRYAKLGDSETLRIGETVIAMGNPMMLSSSLTVGVVSNRNRVFTNFIGTEMEEQELDQDQKTGMFTRWIQHDALILPGNSGGPLVNTRGEVVGINELGGGGMGFAIPSATVKRVLKQALAGGTIRRGWLGVTLLPVRKLDRKTGALVSAITPGSPAVKAGLAPGDILLKIGSEKTNVRFFEEVPPVYQRIADLPIGSRVSLHFLRAGKLRTSVALIDAMPPIVGDDEEVTRLGITIRGITEWMALSRRLPTRFGVLVTGVRPGYPFENASPKITDGDIITALDGKPTPSPAAFRAAASALKGESSAIAFLRKDESLLSSIKVTPKSSEGDGGELPKAWLGLKTQVVTPEVADALGNTELKGFRVSEVYPWTQAGKAGIRVGDVIVSLNGTDLDASRAQDNDDLQSAIEDLSVGAEAKIAVMRSSARLELTVTLEASPSSAAQAKRAKQEELEFAVRNITPMDRIERRWKIDQKGVIVVDATTGGWAHMAGLHVDDIITSIRGRPVTEVTSFERIMQDVMKRRPRVIAVFVKRGYRTHFAFIEPDWARVAEKRK